VKNTALALFLISLFLFSNLSAAMFVNLAWCNFGPLTPPTLPTPIYIRENGTIEGAAGAMQQTANVYTFLRDINETLEIQKDNIILYGNGFKFTRPPEPEMHGFWPEGTGWYPSIQISNRKNVTVQKIEFDQCHTCVKAENSSNILIVQNKMHNSGTGIYMSSCTDSGVIGNEILDNSVGLFILYSSYLNIAYNVISRNQNHGGWISVSYSNISRNYISNNTAANVGIGLYLYGPNSNNRVFENNFVDNDYGLSFMNTQSGSCTNNTLINNYWSNRRKEIVNADEFNSVDPSPLASPISTAFDPSLFPMPALTPNQSTKTQQPEPFQTTAVITAFGVSLTVIVVGLSFYFKKRRLRAEKPEASNF